MKYLKLILILLIPLVIILVYAKIDAEATIGLVKADLSDLEKIEKANDTLTTKKDSVPTVAPIDTTKQRLLLFGDSMVEGLGPRIAKYAAANGHDLTYVCWYSSNTDWWANTDTLRHFLNEVKPTHVLISLGGNEQPLRDVRTCRKNVEKIYATIGDIPTLWICTPAWKPEVPFNDMAEEMAGPGRFFDSRKLTYERGKDHCHPTHASAAKWMDSIAVWMESPAAAHRIRMKMPADTVDTRNIKRIYLQPKE